MSRRSDKIMALVKEQSQPLSSSSKMCNKENVPNYPSTTLVSWHNKNGISEAGKEGVLQEITEITPRGKLITFMTYTHLYEICVFEQFFKFRMSHSGII